jgi:hypothetical protein
VGGSNNAKKLVGIARLAHTVLLPSPCECMSGQNKD